MSEPLALRRHIVFRGLASLATVAGAYHALRAFGVLPSDESSAQRHLAFVLINVIAAWYALRRPLWLLPAYVVLVVQQTLGHGARAFRWWSESGRLDVISLVVLVGLYTGLVLLLLDARDRSSRVRRFLCPWSTT